MALIEQDAASARMAERFRQYALEGGYPVVAEDGETILHPRRSPGEAAVEEDETAREVEPLPAYVELDSGEPEHLIAITRRSGKKVELRPVITFASARKNGWYQKQINRLAAEADATTDETRVDEIVAEISRFQHAMLRTSIPNLPEGLLEDLSPGQVAGLMAAMERISEESQAETTRIRGKVLGRS